LSDDLGFPPLSPCSISPPTIDLRRRWVRVDYYGALNVSTAANTSEIKTKYRRLALLYHPGSPKP